jgi:phosphoenolpyruvate synthase/pyruvate phosphate dikinase
MVPSQVSGVMFTADPMTSARRAKVSLSPDNTYLCGVTRKSMKLYSRRKARKIKEILLDDSPDTA